MPTTAPASCLYCGGYHTTICPRIEEIDYHENGTVKHVKLRTEPGVIYGVRDGYTAWPPGTVTTTARANIIWGVR